MAISLGQLDLEALKNYLKIVQGFRTVNDPSMDTENVDGVAAGLIAIAALVDGQLLKDENGKDRRDVVNNALNLLYINDKDEQVILPANKILTEDKGDKIVGNATEAAKSTAEDMRMLRNEMYHLKTKMIKSGATTFDQVYNGWIDPFINYDETMDSMDGRFTKDNYQCKPQDGAVVVNFPADTYVENQFAVLLANDGTAIYADEITKVDGKTIILGNGARFVDSEPVAIQKSYGLYHNGQFVFANDQADLLSTNNAVNMIYKDGPSRIKVFEINNPEYVTGYCTAIEIPAELDSNYLNAIGLSIRAVGKPAGQIWCELYRYNKENIYSPNEIVATSEFLNSDNVTSLWKTHKFHFRENDIKIQSGERYLLIIKGTVSDVNNVWCIGGFEENCNMTVHQDTFIYREGSVVVEQIAPDLNRNVVSDAFVGLYTTETQQVVLNYSKYGLYTGTFNLEHAQARRVRVSFNPRGSEAGFSIADVDTFYKVNVVGRVVNDSALYEHAGQLIPGIFEGEIKEFSHVVVAGGETSANEFVYDFVFDEPVNQIEFQILYNNPYNIGHGSLFSVVVSTDNAYLGGEE